MTRRIINQRLPDAPLAWDPSSKEAWRRLITVLENSELFDASRRTLPEFIVQGSLSPSVTVDVDGATLAELRAIVGRLIIALDDSKFLTARDNTTP
jgi:hypothetical protein